MRVETINFKEGINFWVLLKVKEEAGADDVIITTNLLEKAVTMIGAMIDVKHNGMLVTMIQRGW